MKRSTYTLRRLLALVLVLVMVGSLFAGCNKKTDDPTLPEEPSGTNAATAAPTDEATEAPTEEPTEAPTEPEETVPPVLMGTVNADNLNVRSEPYSTADILKRLAINTRIEILEQKIVDGVNWGRIAEGWINLNYVTIGVEFPEPGTSNVVNNDSNIGTGSVTTNDNTTGTVTTGLNIRKESNADSASVGTYAKGDKVTILERNGDWGRTNKGWINLKYVDFTNSVTSSSSSSSGSSGTNSATVSNGNSVPLGNGTVVKTTSLAIRSGPGANYTQVSYIRKGETHDYFQTSSNGWVRMKKGWVNADYLELEYYLEDGTEVTVTANELTVRMEADYNSEKLHTYEKNDEITILDVKGTWGMVEYASGQYGWVDLDKVKLPTPTASNYATGIATVTADALHIREKASASSDSLGVLEEGDKVEIIEVNGNWGKFELDNGDYGWINLKYTKMKTTYTTGTGYITASKLNVREEPDEDSDKIGSLSNGDKVIILDTEGTWGKILYDEDDDEYGWISLKYVKITSTSTGTTTTPTTPAATKYTVTINRPDNGTVTTSAASYEKGATVTLNATPASGFQLQSYYVVDANDKVVSVSGNTFTMPEANVTVTATFANVGASTKTYTVTCESATNGGVTASPDADTSKAGAQIAPGTKVTLTISPNSEYALSSLTVKAGSSTIDCAADYSFTMPAADVTVTASFSKSSSKSYAVTTNAVNGTLSTNLANAASGATVTLTATPSTGYELSTITVVNNSTGSEIAVSGTGNNRSFTMPAANVTASATFTKVLYDVTVSSVTGGTASVDTTKCAMGTTVTVTYTPATGYSLQEIKVYGPNNELVTVVSATFAMPAYDVTVVPVFTKDTYAITIGTPVGPGTLTASPTTAAAGTTITLTATPEAFRKLGTLTVKTTGGADVTVNGTGNIRTFTMPESAVTVTATFPVIAEYKTVDKAKMRDAASTDGKELQSFTAGVTVYALEEPTGEWVKTTVNEKTGYIHISGLTKVE